jgi:DNA recombination protein RmuC
MSDPLSTLRRCMNEIGFVLLGLAVGALAAALVLGVRGTPGAAPTERLEARLDVQTAELRRIADGASSRDAAAEHLLADMAGARRALEALSVREEERRERDRESWEVVRRISNVLAGSASKGQAGENVLREHLGQLPPGMLVTDLRVNGRVVEFGLLLPDGRRLPVDSKWSAVAEIEALEACSDPHEREALARDVERLVTARAREVAGYLDPALTCPVAVAAVPDAAYAVLRRAHADAFARGVVIVPYSTALPVLLFLYSLAHRFGDADDARTALQEVSTVLDAMQGVIENKIVRAGTMVANGVDELRSSLGQARGSIARSRTTAQVEDADDLDGILKVVQ